MNFIMLKTSSETIFKPNGGSYKIYRSFIWVVLYQRQEQGIKYNLVILYTNAVQGWNPSYP